MNFDRLRHFEAVARHGSFVHAAGDLHITQPALTRSVQVLEREIGGQLFDRRRHKIALTGFGRFVLERVQVLVSSHNQLSHEIERFKGGERGHLHVGFGPLPAETLAARCISRFQGEHPRISLRVSFLATDEMVNAVTNDRVEVLIGEPDPQKAAPDFRQVGLRRRPGFFYCRFGHPVLKKQSPTLEDLAEYPFVGFKLSPEFAGMAEAGKFGDIDPVTGLLLPKVECYSIAATKQIVAASNGIGAATLSMMWREIRDGELAPIALVIPGFETAYSIITSRSRTLSLAAQAFVEIVQAIDEETEESLPRSLGTKSRYLASIAPSKRDRVSAKQVSSGFGVASASQRVQSGKATSATRKHSSSR
jgi:DNA-binding transcriptional LysR family regulator